MIIPILVGIVVFIGWFICGAIAARLHYVHLDEEHYRRYPGDYQHTLESDERADIMGAFWFGYLALLFVTGQYLYRTFDLNIVDRVTAKPTKRMKKEARIAELEKEKMQLQSIIAELDAYSHSVGKDHLTLPPVVKPKPHHW